MPLWLTCDLQPVIIVAPFTLYYVHKEWECLALVKHCVGGQFWISDWNHR